MKEKLAKIFVAVLFIGLGLYLLITGITDLTSKSDYVEAEIDMAGGNLTVEHSINGLIPIGNEYYYIGVNSEEGSIYIVRATKKWLDQNFDADGKAIGGSYTLKAKKRKLDYKVEREYSDSFSDMDMTGFQLVTGTSSCLDTDYKTFAVKKLVCVFAFLLTLLCIFAGIKERDENRKPVWGKVMVVSLLISAALMIHVLSFL